VSHFSPESLYKLSRKDLERAADELSASIESARSRVIRRHRQLDLRRVYEALIVRLKDCRAVAQARRLTKKLEDLQLVK
jgi:hypothetical protein